jgi:hypothetical protein
MKKIKEYFEEKVNSNYSIKIIVNYDFKNMEFVEMLNLLVLKIAAK